MSFEKMKEFFGFQDMQHGLEEDPSPTPQLRSFKGAVLHNPLTTTKQKGMSEIKIEEPKIYEDSLNVSSYLREGKPVIINLKYLDTDSGKRFIDFVCGTAYAINGHMMKIGENIFLFTPSNVLISESADQLGYDQTAEQDDRDVFFKKVHTA
jgi:cell division inhibitor SepF